MSVPNYLFEIGEANINTILRVALNVSLDTSLTTQERLKLTDALRARYHQLQGS